MANKYQRLFNFSSNHGMQIKANIKVHLPLKVMTELEWKRFPGDLSGEKTED